MCSVSMVTDHWIEKTNIFPDGWQISSPVSREEFNRLKEEVEKLREELKLARQEDIETNAPDCKMKESVEIVRKLAEWLGVDMEDVFEGHK